jgi:hypothetical protein
MALRSTNHFYQFNLQSQNLLLVGNWDCKDTDGRKDEVLSEGEI